ncbi:MAG: 2-oxoglutarate dehydrogenase E2 component (dihydrolipoamide succinyltransferase) [Crocinitomicaceae bacterium]|jgi:2-oxoglutarate dehydrogenase E2 component (dihydrolipoamide succinyltransferase)
MSFEVIIPNAGESVTSANVAEWHVADGASVSKGDILLTIETDKVSQELESEQSGILQILIPEGEEVAIGTVVAMIAAADAATPAVDEPTEVSAEVPAEDPTPAVVEDVAPADPAPVAKVAATPAPVTTPAKAVATPAAKPSLSVFAGSGEKAGAPVREGRTTRKKMSMLRRKIATHLVNAQQSAAILTTFNEVDMSAIMKLRKEVQEDFIKKHDCKLGFMSIFVKAVSQALKDVPSINGRIEGTDVIQNNFIDIGCAIGTDKGLVVPVLRDCDQKGFATIEKEILDYATKARDGKIEMSDLQGGSFTISNGGVYGSLLSTPILNSPQSGILGMHTIQQRPVAVDGKVEIRPMMYLALSYDHRLVDGKEAVTFLIRIKECLENPTRMMLEM